MPYKDPQKAREASARRKRAFIRRRKIEKYGAEFVDVDMRGRHGNHAKGPANGQWNQSPRRLTTHGYVAVRVQVDHQHAWGPPHLKNFKYAYEHIVVMMAHIGRPLAKDEVVHHRNGDRADNRIENLELTTAGEHQRYHTTQTRERDTLGRFL